MKLTLFASLTLPLLLTQCVEPFGPNDTDPYANPYRQDMRDQGAQVNSMAFERGEQDGHADALQQQSENFRRHSSRFDRNTEMAYRDGYNHRYSQTINSRGQGSSYPNQGVGRPQQTPAPRDPVYNQGYDYGLRDRTAGRVADPAAQVGRYDPRYRASFDRGYDDGYNASASNTQGVGSWFR